MSTFSTVSNAFFKAVKAVEKVSSLRYSERAIAGLISETDVRKIEAHQNHASVQKRGETVKIGGYYLHARGEKIKCKK